MRFYVVDAFTDRPYRGNPAGVCLLPTGDWPDDGWMMRVAAEMNFSETAFALPQTDGGADWAIRWFAPLTETNLCGHATLATAHTLRVERGTVGTVRFTSRYSGTLITHATEDGSVTLDFPAAPGTHVPVPQGLAAALGTEPETTLRTGALGDLLTVLPDERAVRGASPDLEAVAELTRREGLRGVIITAPADPPEATETTGATEAEPEYHFVSRFFSPAEGIMEDPVTGSAHTALAPYWSSRLGRDGLTGLQASARTGLVRTAVHGDRVHLTGNAVTVLDGTLRT